MQNIMRGKLEYAIRSLPKEPTKRIYWIVYNQDMVEFTAKRIAEIRGQDYLDKYITVVAKGDPSKERTTGSVYFDPLLYDHLGNGNV